MTPLVLASRSPRRQAFISLLPLPFATYSADIDETPLLKESPRAFVKRLSRQKAHTVATKLPLLITLSFSAPVDWSQAKRLLIIAADTDVVLNGEILSKPSSPQEAADMLRRLREAPHQVYSGFSIGEYSLREGLIISPNKPHRLKTYLHSNHVWMRPYSEAEIAAYVATGDPLDKAGAYGIQHPTFAPVARFQGCFASIMGLPLAKVALALSEFGLTMPPVASRCQLLIEHLCCQARPSKNR